MLPTVDKVGRPFSERVTGRIAPTSIPDSFESTDVAMDPGHSWRDRRDIGCCQTLLVELCATPMNDLLPSSYSGVVAEDTVVVPGNNIWKPPVALDPPGGKQEPWQKQYHDTAELHSCKLRIVQIHVLTQWLMIQALLVGLELSWRLQ